MLDGKGSFNVFHDISGINRALGESEKTLELFKQIETNASARPERLWIIVQDLAFEHKEFELINRYIEDIEQEYRLAYSDYIRDLGLFTNDEHLKWVRRTFKKKPISLSCLPSSMVRMPSPRRSVIGQRTYSTARTASSTKRGVFANGDAPIDSTAT